ncbi:MAG: hypothetical protein QM606_04385 [Leucobacter sp.]
MILTYTAAAVAQSDHWGGGPGHWGGPPWPLFIFFPLFLLLIAGLVFALVFRRRGSSAPPWARGSGAPGGPGAGGGSSWARPQSGPSAEQVLADRFARGDIEEVEYRARLEVLRAARPES